MPGLSGGEMSRAASGRGVVPPGAARCRRAAARAGASRKNINAGADIGGWRPLFVLAHLCRGAWCSQRQRQGGGRMWMPCAAATSAIRARVWWRRLGQYHLRDLLPEFGDEPNEARWSRDQQGPARPRVATILMSVVILIIDSVLLLGIIGMSLRGGGQQRARAPAPRRTHRGTCHPAGQPDRRAQTQRPHL